MGSQLLGDDAAVPMVVGATLTVGIAVVLAASSGVLILGLGDGTDSDVPTANFTYEYSQVGDGELWINYDSGDSLDPRNVVVETGTQQFHPAPGNTSGASGQPVTAYRLNGSVAGGDWVAGDLEAGQKFGLVGASHDSLERATVRIVWADPTGDRSATLGEWQGPDA